MKPLLFLFAIFCTLGINAQNIPNPYASIGKPAPKVTTLTNGAYDEFLLKDSLVLINGDAIRRKTGELVYTQEEHPEIIAQLQEEQKKKYRFLSVDPIARGYPELTPYQFASNKPIRYVDVDGMEAGYLWNASGLNPNATGQNAIDQTWTVIKPGLIFTGKALLQGYLMFITMGESEIALLTLEERALIATEERAILATEVRTVESKVVAETPKTITHVENEATTAEVTSTQASASNSQISPPKVKAQLNPRHYKESNAIAKASKTGDATVGPRSILDADVAEYNAGNFTKTTNGNVVVNNRTYGLKNEGKTIFPVKDGAPEFMDLSQGQIKAIQIMKTTQPSNLQKALTGARISAEDIKFASDFISNY